MKQLIKTLAASAVLLTATQQALAQVTVPTQPAPGPFPVAGGNTANGPLLVVVWNNQGSLVQWLGLNLDQVGEAAMTPDAGLVLDFGTLDRFGATFTNPQSPISYAVMTARAGTNFTNNILETTASAAPLTTNNGLQGGVRVYRDFILNSLNASGGCSGTNSCATTDALSQQYAGDGDLMASMFSNLGFNQAAAIGSPLNFYRLQGSGTNPALPLNGVAFDNAQGLGQWLLNTAGGLTYTVAANVVPLPAAAWLLLSGLAGLATVSRRKRAA